MKVTFKQRLGGNWRGSLANTWGKNIPGRVQSTAKYSLYVGNSQECRVAAAEQVRITLVRPRRLWEDVSVYSA